MHMMISVAYISSISPSQNASRPSAPSKVQTIIKVTEPSLQNMHLASYLRGYLLYSSEKDPVLRVNHDADRSI